MCQTTFDNNPQANESYDTYCTDSLLECRWKQLSVNGKQTPGVIPTYNPLDQPPDWFDQQRLLNAQQLSKKYLFSLNMSHLIGNILLVLLPEVLVPIAATGTSGNAYQVLLRVLSTVIHINSWYDGNPFDPNTRTHASLLQVRRGCHLQVTKLLNQKYPDEKKAHPLLDENNLWLSQYDMVMTQWSLIGIIAACPDQCAFYVESAIQKLFKKLIQIQNELNSCHQVAEMNIICDTNQEYLLFVNIIDTSDMKLIEKRQVKHDFDQNDLKHLYELQEFMYLWRVLGYCMGIHNSFNVCGYDCIVRNVIFSRICLDRGYRSILCKPNPLVTIGLRLVKGLFLALSFIIPKWIISYEAFMKYWYDALKIPHSFQLNNQSQKISYWLTNILINTVLRSSFLYQIWSLLYFWLLERLLKQVRCRENMIKNKCGYEKYQVLDSNGNPFEIVNKLYKSNV